MTPRRRSHRTRLPILFTIATTMGWARVAYAQAPSIPSSPAGPSVQTVGEILARADYIAIPFRWLNGQYQIIDATVDTTKFILGLDSGHTGTLSLDTSLAHVSGIDIAAKFDSFMTVYGPRMIRRATITTFSMGGLAMGPQTGIISTFGMRNTQGLVGASILTTRAAFIDFATDTLYLRRGAAHPAPLSRDSSRTLRQTLEAAGHYRTLLSLMEAAKMTSFLERSAADRSAFDSVVLAQRNGVVRDVLMDTISQPATLHDIMERWFRRDGHLTLFAPTDAAFAGVAPDTLRAIRADPSRLAALLHAHMVPGTRLSTADLRTAVRAVGSPSGSYLLIYDLGPSELDVSRSVLPDRLVMTRARLIEPDLVGINGIAHGIDRVLIPSAASTEPSAMVRELARQGYTAVPLHLMAGGSYYVEGIVNGTIFNLIVDTGAPTYFDLDLTMARQFQIARGMDVSLTLGKNGPTLTASPALNDLSMFNPPNNKNAPIQGILGSEFLTRHRARFDLGTGVLYLTLKRATPASP